MKSRFAGKRCVNFESVSRRPLAQIASRRSLLITLILRVVRLVPSGLDGDQLNREEERELFKCSGDKTMDLDNAIAGRRSVRDYTSQGVDEKVIQNLIDLPCTPRAR